MQKSLAAKAEDVALDHKLVIRRAVADGVISPEEITQITRSAERVHHSSRAVHRAERKGISIIRVGYAAPWIDQELGPEPIEELIGS